MKTINNPYGYFDIKNKEFVITRPDTPTPWMNYLGEGRYGGIISNTAGGYSFDRDPRSRRVTRYRYNAIPMDQPGRYIYMHDMQNGVYWSPTWQPVVAKKLDRYECRHGAGYTSISSLFQEITVSLLYFVPLGEACELWVLSLRNDSKQQRWLRTFSYVEFGYWDTNIDQHNLDWGSHIVHSDYQEGVIKTFTQFRPTTTFFTSNRSPLGFDTDREVFIGRYHDLSNPLVVEQGQPMNSLAPRGNNIGSLCHDFKLAPGEEVEIIYILGITDEPTTIPDIRHRYIKSTQVKSAFKKLDEDWSNYLSTMQVRTPDPDMDAMLNFWNLVQCRSTLYWSRFVSAYETGLGRGMGTRDSAQDTFATVQSVPTKARETLDMLWHLQFKDGHTWHQVYPLTGEGGQGHAAEFPDWPQWFSDDHIWLIQAEISYLRETGDFGSLIKQVPYWGGEDPHDTIWDHIVRGIEFTCQNRGPHGLPRMGFSDWDDTLNLDHGSGKAESVMAAQQFCRVMLDLVELCEYMGKTSEVERFRSLFEEMKGIINRFAWDGAWYIRAFDDNGSAIGIHGAESHEIALNTQTWAVIGEVDLGERAQQAMNSAHERLNTPYGLAIMLPGYQKPDGMARGTSTYPPGGKENAGIFCHANTWAIVAATKLGWGDRAYQYYRQFLPMARQDSDILMVEPYVYCGNLCGPEHPHFGRGRNAWLSGTASWSYIAATQWILGIRPTFNGLQIFPVLPIVWKGYSASRIFRGVTYEIQVEKKGEGRQISIEVDGKPVSGDIVPFPPADVKLLRIDVSIQ
jgi:cellobiose phosphorylase